MRWIAIAAALFAAGCAARTVTPPEPPGAAYEAALSSWHEARLAEGEAIYQRACARCHDPGASAAPGLGVRADWNGRSALWTAVLTEHARRGYLSMPPRGGDPALTDREVGAATEYMLTVTYPHLQSD